MTSMNVEAESERNSVCAAIVSSENAKVSSESDIPGRCWLLHGGTEVIIQ